MGIENFISEALCKPGDYVSYYVSRRLAELYPEKSVIEGETDSFDLEAYGRARQCEMVREAGLYNQIATSWWGQGKDLRHDAENAWFNVFWQGHFMEVIFVNWTDDGCKSRHHWIVAESQELAESFFRAVCEWCAEVRGEILVFENGGWDKSKELLKAIKVASFDNLILPRPMRDEIRSDFRQFFASRDAYEKYGLPWKRGVLLIGPPGNGKTHTVKALINELKQPCLYVKSFKARYLTEQAAIGCVFHRARRTIPCLVVMEDLDSLITDKTRSYFLNELDGFALNTGVVVLATTNHPERLDAAILDRPSRFDRKYYFELPAPVERSAYLSRWNEGLQPEMRVSPESLADVVARTDGFSFAYLKELFLSSMMEWMSDAGRARMDAIIMERANRLREQMNSAVEAQPDSADDDTEDED